MITPEQLADGTEVGEQKAVFCWAGLNRHLYPQLKWLHAIPNQNSHRMIAEGVRAGIPDIMLPWPNYQYAGLWIELKIKKGKVSKSQEECIAYLSSVGYKAVVCWSWMEAKTELENYLCLTKTQSSAKNII